MVDAIADPIVLPYYPNVLAEPRPKRFVLARRPLVLLGLLFLCFFPRAVIAVKCPSIGGDATLYIKLAKAIDQGDLHGGFSAMRLNTFPAILATLHRVGFDWEAGGRWWGVVMASLVVFPLFGWIRRQFDDRVALAACFLYAVHPRFIEWSPYVVRDPTFWFLLASSLYLLWRAVSEVRLGMFAAAGIVSTLAVMTRTEGLFLLIPFALWAMWRWLALKESRWRLVIGVLIYILITPAILFLINVTVLRGHSSWEICRLPEFSLIQQWNESFELFGEESPNANAVQSSQASSLVEADHVPRMHIDRMPYKYACWIKNGFTAVFGLLLLGGIWNWRRIWARRDNQPLFYFAVIILVGIWLDYWQTGQSSTRYPLPIALMASPFAGLALLGISQWLCELAHRFNRNVRWQRVALFAPAVLVAAVSLPEALIASSRRYDTLEAYASIGRWLQSESNVKPVVLGHVSVARIVGYHTGFETIPINVLDGPGTIAKAARNHKVKIILLSKTKLRLYDATKLLEEIKNMGYERIDPTDLPRGTDFVMVFVRKPGDNKVTVEKTM